MNPNPYARLAAAIQRAVAEHPNSPVTLSITLDTELPPAPEGERRFTLRITRADPTAPLLDVVILEERIGADGQPVPHPETGALAWTVGEAVDLTIFQIFPRIRHLVQGIA